MRKIQIISEDNVERALALTSVIALAGVIKELDLPVVVQTLPDDNRKVELYCLDQHWWLVEDKKEQVREALFERGLDVMLVRKLMRFVYATTVEEP